ncbi:MAG: hypothetical protein HYY02_00275 [Chloroflexi bacterium]|nr:hypothetical protein [Chloroflexota bacterium]
MTAPLPARLPALSWRWWFTPLAIGLTTAAAIPINGYFYGIYDHAYHLARLRWLQDPSIYNPDDPFVGTLEAYPSIFWALLLPLEQLLPEPSLFLALYFLSRCLFGYMVLRYTRLVYGSEATAWLAFSFFLLEKTTSGFYGLPDREFLPRTPVLPLTLVAMELYLRNRPTLALGLAGLLVNLHGRLAFHLLFLLGLGLLWQRRQSGGVGVVRPLLVAGLAAAPALWWQLQHPSGVPLFPPDPQWVSIVKLAVPSLQNVFAPEPAVVFMHLSSLGFVALFFLAAPYPASQPLQRTLTLWVLTAVALVVTAGLVVDVVPVPPLMQLELVRAGMFLPIIALPAFAHALVRVWAAGELRAIPAVLLALAGLWSPFGSFTALPAALARFARGRMVRLLLVAITVPVIALSVAFFWFRHTTAQNWLVAPPVNSWTEVARWAREQTPQDAVFLIPPYLDTATLGAEFRVAAQRSNVVARHEGDLSGLSYRFALAWYQRLRDLAGGQELAGAPLADLSARLEQGFLGLSQGELEGLARRYGADYLLLERRKPLTLPVAYENEQFLVYRLPSALGRTP